MTAIDYLRSKHILDGNSTEWIVRYQDGTQLNLVETVQAYADQQNATLREQIADYEQMHESHKKLVRELDVIINGENAAKQASLCDVVSQLSKDIPRLRE